MWPDFEAGFAKATNFNWLFALIVVCVVLLLFQVGALAWAWGAAKGAVGGVLDSKEEGYRSLSTGELGFAGKLTHTGATNREGFMGSRMAPNYHQPSGTIYSSGGAWTESEQSRMYQKAAGSDSVAKSWNKLKGMVERGETTWAEAHKHIEEAESFAVPLRGTEYMTASKNQAMSDDALLRGAML